MKRMNFTLDNETIQSIDMIHRLTGMKKSKIVRKAIRRMVKDITNTLDEEGESPSPFFMFLFISRHNRTHTGVDVYLLGIPCLYDIYLYPSSWIQSHSHELTCGRPET